MSKIRVFVNQHARKGKQKAFLRRIEGALQGLEVELSFPRSYEELVEGFRRAVAEKAEAVIAVGGDGTINIALNQLAGSGVPLGVIPIGTANDLTTHLGIGQGIERACAAIRAGKTRTLDLIKINDRCFVTGGGLGIVSETAIGVNRLKAAGGISRRIVRALGSAIYVAYSFGYLFLAREYAPFYEIFIDGQAKGKVPAVGLFVHNQPSIGKMVRACPEARPDDGLLDVCVMGKRNRLQTALTIILMSLGGIHSKRRDITLWTGKRVEILTKESRTFIGDGEVLARGDRLVLEVMPGAIQVFCPGGSVAVQRPA